jgi:hypothetical protein
VEHDALGLVPLAKYGSVGVVKSCEVLLVPLPLPLELLSDFLLEYKGLQSVVALLLGTRQADGKSCGIILLLVNKAGKAAVLAFVVLDLDLEILGLLGELLSESLKLEELLLPALELLNQEVVSLSDFAKLGIHAALEVDEVLPSFLCVTGVLIALSDDLVEMAHRNLGH